VKNGLFCLYIYGKRVSWDVGPGQSEEGGGVGVVGVKWVCRHGRGGGVYKSLGAAGGVKFLLLSFEVVY
jgi:hypothetical protein